MGLASVAMNKAVPIPSVKMLCENLNDEQNEWHKSALALHVAVF